MSCRLASCAHLNPKTKDAHLHESDLAAIENELEALED